MDVFEKCSNVGPVQDLMDAGFHAYYREIGSGPDPEVKLDGRRMIMLGSNNYLGLASHPSVKAAAMSALEAYGTGTTGSRCLNGTLDIHADLERRLARFFHREECIYYTSGYMTNLGVISGLAHRGDFVIVDRRAHASILDAAHLSEAEVKRFRHNDMKDLERVLASCGQAGKLVAIDGVYSMDGDIAPLPRIVQLCREHGARLVLDDAHGLGVMGESGRGTAEHFGVEDGVDVLIGTASKALPGLGGFAVAERRVIHFLRYTNRPFIFATSPAPAVVGAVREALAVLEREPALRRKLWANTRRVLHALQLMGFDTGGSQTPIVPIIVGTVERTFHMWKALSDEGIFVNVVLPPAVPAGSCIIRMTFMATHTDEQIDRVLETLERVGAKLGIIQDRREEARKAG
jgi:8-amino-7-oxononanoate synthase